jgi:hypothetical protein
MTSHSPNAVGAGIDPSKSAVARFRSVKRSQKCYGRSATPLSPPDTIVLDLGLRDQFGLDIDHQIEHRAVSDLVT